MGNKNISLLEFESNPNIGLYMFANDKFCLVGPQLSEEKKKNIEKILNVKVYSLTMLATELIGVFAAGNNDILIIPEVYDYEYEKIEKICKEHSVNLLTINERLNTFGNNLCVGKDKIIINPDYPKAFQKILKEKTNMKIIPLINKEFIAVGSICKYLNDKFFLSQEIKEDEVKKFIDEIGGIGTVNAGSNMVSSGIVGNSKGLLLGSMCSTIEIQNITESLDYI